jgi:hypothetical protein
MDGHTSKFHTNRFCMRETSHIMGQCEIYSCGSSVSVATSLLAGRSGFDPGSGREGDVSVPASRPVSCPMEPRGSSLAGKAPGGVNLTTHLHLMLRLRMHGAISPLSNTSSLRDASLIGYVHMK